ncbi:DUF3606 domain-containing protein [Marinobacter sp.]|uniref:DUF3606 domain-containing protein n=1 Tax=Marinobacter sp. TaxID=50741 RepID=UPI0035C7761C
MSDDLERTGPEDPKKININQSWEVTYWCKALGVSEKELREAVEAVGPLVADVKAHIAVLRQRRQSTPSMGM